MDADTFRSWVAIIIALSGVLSGGYAIFSQRRKDIADVAEKYQKIASLAAAEVLLLKSRIDVLERRVSELEAFENWAYRLEHQLRASGLTPMPMEKVWASASGAEGMSHDRPAT